MSRIRTVPALVALVALTAALALPGTAQAVVGGTPPSRDYPFMAAMLWNGLQSCGGSLVAEEYVLTAAHCWDDGDQDTADPEPREVQFVIGGVNLTLEQGERIDAASVEVHPFWDPDEFTYDVALVQLSGKARAKPIPIADSDLATDRGLWIAEPGPTAPRKPARVIGYGLPSFDPPGALFETDVPMVADETCEDNYDLTIGGFKSTTMVCAGEPYGVKDSCPGDSGGPLFVSRSGDFAADDLVQVGVVSWGFLCGVPTQHGVYSRIGDDPLNDWIQDRIGGTSTAPDATPPETTIDSGPSGTTADKSPSFSYSSSEPTDATFQCKLDGPGPGTYGDCTPSPKTYSNLADGSYTFSVKAKDAAGNEDPSPATRSFTVSAPAPTQNPTTTQSSTTNPTPPPIPGLSPDATRPVLSGLSFSRTRFRAARSGASTATAIGTRVSYTLSEAAAVRFGVERALPGRRVGGRCVRVTASNRSARRCTRYPTMRGSFSDRGERGSNRFSFRGRLAGSTLRPGRYRLRAVARDRAGNRSTLRRSRGFRIVRR